MIVTCGFDEAGRGPLAGPVTAACVVLGPDFDPKGLGDSKVLNPKNRMIQAQRIQSTALAWGIATCTPREIDELNILQASLRAMERAWFDLGIRFPGVKPELGLIDGLHCPIVPFPCRAIVRGDALEPCISAASILAKVSRDAQMLKLDALYPQYGFALHKGYPTVHHREMLRRHGLSPEHRLSFRWHSSD